AEDPANEFMSQTGKIALFEPAVDEGVRIDHGIYSGAIVSSYYDAMLAKVIAWGRDREQARRRLIRALKQTKLLGLTTNKTFLIQLLAEDQFINGEATTAFISHDVLKRANPALVKADLALTTVLLHQNSINLNGWSNSAPLLRTETLLAGDGTHAVKILQTAGGFDVFIENERYQISAVRCYEDEMVYTLDGVTRVAYFSIVADVISLDLGDRVLNFTRTTYHPVVAEGEAGSGLIKASTEGLVVDVLVKPGDKVNKGDPLVLIEAMKMEHRHLADGDGEVTRVSITKGQQVKNRQLLVELALTEVVDESA
ncbi:MAG: biotin/lipoyl-binding protein, partial [SAR324 cluster bacterium]|nr:biotin/lipoyl-binding protein [SAR324 cluster bacterium]